MPQELSALLAVQAPLPHAAQRAALGLPHLHEKLAANTLCTLHDDVWADLWDGPGDRPATLAIDLVSRELSPAHIDHVLSTESRATVIAALVEANAVQITQARLLSVLDGEVGPRKKGAAAAKAVAKVVAATGIGGPEAAAKAAQLLGGHVELAWITSDSCDLTEARARLERFGEWGPRPSGRRSRGTADLLEAKPALLEAFISSEHLDLRQAAAGSRHLASQEQQQRLLCFPGATVLDPVALDPDQLERWRYILIALVWSPVTFEETVRTTLAISAASPGLGEVLDACRRRLAAFANKPRITVAYDAVEDRALLEWLIGRSVPGENFDGSPRAGKPHDLAALAMNPYLDGHLAARLHRGLGDWDVITRLGPRLDAVAASIEARHPELAQQTLVGCQTQPPREAEFDTPERDYEPAQVRGRVVATLAAGSWSAGQCAAHIADSLVTEEEWRIAFGLIDNSGDITVGQFIETVQALA